MTQTITREITSDTRLCDARGSLSPEAIGWSRHPFHICNLSGRPFRKKKWNYWCITSDRFAFSATIAHIDYMALGSAYLLEYDTRRFTEKTVIRPFSKTPIMPETVAGDVRYDHKGLRLAFQTTPRGLHMNVEADDIDGRPLSADLQIDHPDGHETLNVVVPWNPRTFQFTSKQHCLPTTGTVTLGDETFTFEKDAAFACLDYGRGIWPCSTEWNWAALSARSGPDVIGANMGAKWTDHTGMNENGILLNGVLYKVFDDILFEYDRNDFMAPWHMKTADSDTLDLTFNPFFDRATSTNLLILRSRVHQMFGHYSGILRVGERTIRLDGVPGWAEEHVARW
jgi:hypothetical protein